MVSSLPCPPKSGSLACTIVLTSFLRYNSEIWGVYTKPDFKTWDGSQIEKARLQFCNRYLKVNYKASNIACRAELGRFPFNITINQKILNFILYIQSKDEESFVKQSSLKSLTYTAPAKMESALRRNKRNSGQKSF